MQPLSESCSALDSVSVGIPPAASSALVMASILTRLASDWDDDDPAYDPRCRFEEDSDTGDEGDDEFSSIETFGIDRTSPDYLPARQLDDYDVASPLEDSQVSWVDSPVSAVSESTSPTSEDDGPYHFEVPSPIILKPIHKRSGRRHGIYGGLALDNVHENSSSEVLVDSPVSDSTSPTSIGGESDEFEELSAKVLERSREHLNRRLAIFGDTSKHVLSPAKVSFPVPTGGAVACDGLSFRRQMLVSTHSLRPQRKRVSGLQPLQLPRIVSMRTLPIGDPPPVNTFQRLSPEDP